MATSKATAKTTSKTPGKGKKSTTAAVTGKVVKAAKPKLAQGEDQIRVKALEIYNERVIRGEHGTAESDWLKAEKLLAGKKK